MDSNIPGTQHMQSHLQQQYAQSITNNLAKNDKQQYGTLPNRQSGYPLQPRMGRNIATVGPISGKPYHMDPPGETPPEMFAPSQIMCSGIMKYENDPSSMMQNYQRAPMVSQQQPMNMPPYQSSSSPIMMAAEEVNIRGPPMSMSSHHQGFNQIGNPLPMEMTTQPHQQRFHSQQMQTGSRFPQHQFPENMLMMPDGSSMPSDAILNCRGMSIIHSTYDNFAGVQQQQQPINCKPMSTPQAPIHPRQHPAVLRSTLNEGIGSNTSQSQFMPQAPAPPNINNPTGMPMNQRPVNIELLPDYQQNTVCTTQVPMATRFPCPPPMQVAIRTSLKSETSYLPLIGPQPIVVPAQGTPCAQCRSEINTPGSGDKPLDMPGPRQPQQQQQHFLPIQCEAGCREWFHLTCSGLTPEAFFLLKEEPLAEWLCTPCATRAYPNIPYTRIRT